MSILIVGAGAGGGYIGAQLVAAGREVTFLVRPGRVSGLAAEGIRIRYASGMSTTPVHALAASQLRGGYDVVVVAVRSGAVAGAISDIGSAVGPQTQIVPIVNGIGHLALLTGAFGPERVLGAATRLVASMGDDGVIDVVTTGIDMQLGRLDGSVPESVRRAAAELAVDGITVSISSDILTAMWEKFAFIAATAVLTCVVGEEIGSVARADGGVELARAVLAEVSAVASAEGRALSQAFRSGLDATLTDPSSTFGPSMFRDLRAGRPVERTVLEDLAGRARRHRVVTPLLDAALVVIDIHNRR